MLIDHSGMGSGYQIYLNNAVVPGGLVCVLKWRPYEGIFGGSTARLSELHSRYSNEYSKTRLDKIGVYTTEIKFQESIKAVDIRIV